MSCPTCGVRSVDPCTMRGCPHWKAIPTPPASERVREAREAVESLAGALCEALYLAFPASDHHDSQPCAYCLTRVRNAAAAVRAEEREAVRSGWTVTATVGTVLSAPCEDAQPVRFSAMEGS